MLTLEFMVWVLAFPSSSSGFEKQNLQTLVIVRLLNPEVGARGSTMR